MKTLVKPPSVDADVPALKAGDRLTRDEFERRYRAMPHINKAELIEGVVYMPSPVRFQNHGKPDGRLGWWLTHYTIFTPGVEAANNTTIRLDLVNEPQPDGLLFISPKCGGRVRISDDDFLLGGPDLVGEVAASSTRIDLGAKLDAYRRNNVQEYMVWRVLDRAVDWFTLRQGDYVPLRPGDDGWLRSEVLPGLWLDVPALLQENMLAVLEALQQGLASPEHEAFVKLLVQKRVASLPA